MKTYSYQELKMKDTPAYQLSHWKVFQIKILKKANRLSISKVKGYETY